MVQPHQAKTKANATSLYWVLIISSFPATQSKSKRDDKLRRFSIGSCSHLNESEKNITFAWCGLTIISECWCAVKYRFHCIWPIVPFLVQQYLTVHCLYMHYGSFWYVSFKLQSNLPFTAIIVERFSKLYALPGLLHKCRTLILTSTSLGGALWLHKIMNFNRETSSTIFASLFLVVKGKWPSQYSDRKRQVLLCIIVLHHIK